MRKKPIIRTVFNKKKVINPIPSKSFAIHLNKKKVEERKTGQKNGKITSTMQIAVDSDITFLVAYTHDEKLFNN